NALGEVIEVVEFDELDLSTPDPALAEIADQIKSMVYDADFNRSRLLGAGVAAAISDSSSPDLVSSGPLGWHKFPLQSNLSNLLQLPVIVEPRPSALLKAEMASHSATENIYLVNVALSIGVSAYLDGKVLTSGVGGFGSLAHMTLNGETELCSCGRKGCVDALSSGHAILRELGYGSGTLPDLALEMINVIEKASQGDEIIIHAFKNAGEFLGRGLDSVLSLFDVDKIILAGEVGRQADFRKGVIKGLKQTGRTLSDYKITSSNVTSLESAISTALHEFVFSESLDLERLKSAVI
ncbi:MAG: ROK family protein, partial [Desulfobulbia bacterium]